MMSLAEVFAKLVLTGRALRILGLRVSHSLTGTKPCPQSLTN
jgi:hypothetical protein